MIASLTQFQKLPAEAFVDKNTYASRCAEKLSSHSDGVQKAIRVGLSLILSTASCVVSYILEKRAVQISCIARRYPVMGLIAVAAMTLVYKIFNFNGQVQTESKIQNILREIFDKNLENVARPNIENEEELVSHVPTKPISIGCLENGNKFIVIKILRENPFQDVNQVGEVADVEMEKKVWICHITQETEDSNFQCHVNVQGERTADETGALFCLMGEADLTNLETILKTGAHEGIQLDLS